MSQPNRPTFIGIHAKDDSTQILYISSGCQQAMGYTPEYMISRKAHEFIADPYGENYSSIYDENPDDFGDDGDASAYVMYMNVTTITGEPVLHRLTTFKCDNCVIVVGMAFPDIPHRDRQSLQVQMLDGAMKRLNIGYEKHDAVEKRRREANKNRVPLYFAKNRQVKAAFMLENPKDHDNPAVQSRRLNGPLVAFVTGSISRIVEADPSDLIGYPFLKLVAPEDLVKATVFFDRLSQTPDVLFETFSLIYKPHIIEGDVLVGNEVNIRIEVECLGANVPDGLALLIRRLRTKRPPTDPRNPDSMHARSGVAEIDSDGGYMSLSEIISSDPETSDAPGWSRLR